MSIETYKDWVADYRDRVYNFAYYTLRHAEDAEDVTQEVLIRMWHHHRRLDEPTVLAWLLKVTRNACYDTLRRHRARRARFDEGIDLQASDTYADEAPGPQEHAEADDFQRRLQRALAELPESYRTVVVLREIEGLKYDEIAEITGRPINSVKVYLHRGRKMLRLQLEESDGRPVSEPDGAGAAWKRAAPRDAAPKGPMLNDVLDDVLNDVTLKEAAHA